MQTVAESAGLPLPIGVVSKSELPMNDYDLLNGDGTRRVRIQRFNALAFHDFIVNRGLLPFDLLEQAGMTEFVPASQ